MQITRRAYLNQAAKPFVEAFFNDHGVDRKTELDGDGSEATSHHQHQGCDRQAQNHCNVVSPT